MNLFVRRLVYRPYKLKTSSLSWLLHCLLHPFSSPNLIILARILVIQIGNPTNFSVIARSMTTLLKLVIAAIEALLLLLILILIRYPLLLLLLSTLDPPSHSPQINWRTSSLRLSSGLVMHSLPLLFLSCLVSYPHSFLTLLVAITCHLTHHFSPTLAMHVMHLLFTQPMAPLCLFIVPVSFLLPNSPFLMCFMCLNSLIICYL
jgi:hypothetical protein